MNRFFVSARFSSRRFFQLACGSCLLLTAAMTSACSATKTVKQAKGRYFITCEKGMEDCVSRADKLCGDKGYTILEGYQRTKILGGEGSNYQTAVFVGEVKIACGDLRSEDEVAAHCPAPASPVQVDPAAPPVQTAPANPSKVCVPGSSQACVGPGGCSGGQYCLSDGSGFGRCDCGSTTPTTPAPAPPATPAQPAQPTTPAQPAPPANTTQPAKAAEASAQ